MRKILLGLALILISTTTYDMPLPFIISRPEIVIIDTGTTKSYRGFMRMALTCYDKCWHEHGQKMADSLENEINLQGFNREIMVEHLIWEQSTDIPRLIDNAVALRPKVISLSIAGDEPFLEEFYAIQRAQQANILVIAAAGNHGINRMEYPANYKLDCLVGVSTKEMGRRYPSANLGDIYIERTSGEKGTSFSTARAGAIALKFIDMYKVERCKTLKTLMIEQFGSTQ